METVGGNHRVLYQKFRINKITVDSPIIPLYSTNTFIVSYTTSPGSSVVSTEA